MATDLDIHHLYTDKNFSRKELNFVVDSAKRDKVAWPRANRYDYEFPEPLINVVDVRITNTFIPNPTYTVSAINDVLYVRTGFAQTRQYSSARVVMDTRDYTARDIIDSSTAGQSYTYNLVSLLTPIGVNPTNRILADQINGEVNFITFTGTLPFTIDIPRSTLASTLGFNTDPELAHTPEHVSFTGTEFGRYRIPAFDPRSFSSVSDVGAVANGVPGDALSQPQLTQFNSILTRTSNGTRTINIISAGISPFETIEPLDYSFINTSARRVVAGEKGGLYYFDVHQVNNNLDKNYSVQIAIGEERVVTFDIGATYRWAETATLQRDLTAADHANTNYIECPCVAHPAIGSNIPNFVSSGILTPLYGTGTFGSALIQPHIIPEATDAISLHNLRLFIDPAPTLPGAPPLTTLTPAEVAVVFQGIEWDLLDHTDLTRPVTDIPSPTSLAYDNVLLNTDLSTNRFTVDSKKSTHLLATGTMHTVRLNYPSLPLTPQYELRLSATSLYTDEKSVIGNVAWHTNFDPVDVNAAEAKMSRNYPYFPRTLTRDDGTGAAQAFNQSTYEYKQIKSVSKIILVLRNRSPYNLYLRACRPGEVNVGDYSNLPAAQKPVPTTPIYHAYPAVNQLLQDPVIGDISQVYEQPSTSDRNNLGPLPNRQLLVSDLEVIDRSTGLAPESSPRYMYPMMAGLFKVNDSTRPLGDAIPSTQEEADVRRVLIGNTEHHSLVTPGVVNLVTTRYMVIRCPQIESLRNPTVYAAQVNSGLATFSITTPSKIYSERGILSQLSVENAPFHPISKLDRLSINFVTNLENEVNFYGLDHHFVLSVTVISGDACTVHDTPLNQLTIPETTEIRVEGDGEDARDVVDLDAPYSKHAALAHSNSVLQKHESRILRLLDYT